MDWEKYIVEDKSILLGKPTFINTRISVHHILERLSDGWSVNMILESYPSLTSNHVNSLFSYLKDKLEVQSLAGDLADD